MKKEDRTLLEQAAKAAGIAIQWRDSVKCYCYADSPYNIAWNPLEDDAAAFRLAIVMCMDLAFRRDCAWAFAKPEQWHRRYYEDAIEDPPTSARRAVVQAAASVGESMA